MYSLYLRWTCQATFKHFENYFHIKLKVPFKGDFAGSDILNTKFKELSFSIFVENKTLLNFPIQENLISQQNIAC